MTWSLWLTFFWLEVVLALSPGPAVLFVVGNGLRGGVGAAVPAALGILAGNACYFALSGFGLAALLRAAPWVLTTVTWVGVAYLLYLAASAFGSRGLVGPVATGHGAVRRLAILRAGVLVQVSNPKALLFFTSILPGFVVAGSPWSPGLQILVLGVTSAAAEFVVLWGYGAAAGTAVARMQDPRFARAIDRVAGLLLLAVAVWMAWRSLPA